MRVYQSIDFQTGLARLDRRRYVIAHFKPKAQMHPMVSAFAKFQRVEAQKRQCIRFSPTAASALDIAML